MTTRIEAALQKLFAALETAALAAPDVLPAPTRNHEVATMLESLEGSGLALNLVDGDTTVDAVQLGEIRIYDLTHRAVVELIVENDDQQARDAHFDAALEAIASAIEADDTLDDAVSEAVIENVDRSGHVTDGAPQIKAAAITVALTLQSERPF